MDIQQNSFLVYENWRAENKAVVHKSSCVFTNKGHIRHTNQWLLNNHSPNDRWFGYFNTLDEATAFASLLPNKQLNLCGHCLRNEKSKI
jgi:hypothetical protein